MLFQGLPSSGLHSFLIQGDLDLQTGSSQGIDWGAMILFWLFKLDICLLDLELYCIYRSSEN